ncbi:ribonuclease J [Candidatus Uhrbacteria bacterium]|nr:ribonuclease J [Candidatus Uhrbacteria bacterium]
MDNQANFIASQFDKQGQRPRTMHRPTPRVATSFFPQKVAGSPDGKLRVMVLGGLEEVGRNCTVIEYEDDIIIIDMGVQFPEEDMPGIDYVIPNMSYLKGKEKNIRGVIITHGHYDHIGAIPHCMGQIGNPPMFMGKLTTGIVAKRQEEFRSAPKLDIIIIDEKSKIKLGRNFEVEFFRVNHTIPDSFGIVVNTPHGLVIHSGDFKFDHSPINEPPADLQRIAQLGSRNVLALMLDSTSAEKPGHNISESQVADEIEKIFEKASGRIILGTFASLISRIQIVIECAEKFGRKILIEGRSMQTNTEIAHNLGYLHFKPGTFIEPEEGLRLPDNKLVIIGTGAQGQQNAFLMRFANDEHKYLSVKQGDLVIFSSSVIPGNERTIQGLKDTLYRKGARVIHYQMMDVHAGGHAQAEDLKLMIRLIKPRYFIPIEAYHYMLRIHADLAESVGIPKETIFVADNGQVMEFTRAGGRLTQEKVMSDYVFVDGLGVGDVSEVVLRDRQQMAADGMFVVIATVDKKTGQLMGSPDIISRGFVYMKENKKLIEAARDKVKKIMHGHDPKSAADDMYIKGKLRNEVGQLLYVKTKRRPMILPVVIYV